MPKNHAENIKSHQIASLIILKIDPPRLKRINPLLEQIKYSPVPQPFSHQPSLSPRPYTNRNALFHPFYCLFISLYSLAPRDEDGLRAADARSYNSHACGALARDFIGLRRISALIILARAFYGAARKKFSFTRRLVGLLSLKRAR